MIASRELRTAAADAVTAPVRVQVTAAGAKRSSAAHVAGPTIPSAVRPSAVWKLSTAV